MTMEFILRIEMGNDEMCTTEHLVRALREVANRLEDKSYIEDCQLLEDEKRLPFVRGVQDYNGNTVGEWKFRKEK